ncbi:MAG: hypothetical protein K1X75_11715 [Leptospirales bacterium]|nr:hypothetical protein [Leptospirales bacterium]
MSGVRTIWMAACLAGLLHCSLGEAQHREASIARNERGVESEAQNPGPISNEAIAIVSHAPAIYVYRYAETVNELRPYSDYQSIRKLSDGGLIRDIKLLMAQNRDYQPQFTARCLPVWDYGLEFRISEDRRRMFLFSFRCNTMMSYEDRAYRDFSPQAVQLYALIHYEISDRTSLPIP